MKTCNIFLFLCNNNDNNSRLSAKTCSRKFTNKFAPIRYALPSPFWRRDRVSIRVGVERKKWKEKIANSMSNYSGRQGWNFKFIPSSIATAETRCAEPKSSTLRTVCWRLTSASENREKVKLWFLIRYTFSIALFRQVRIPCVGPAFIIMKKLG